MFSRRSFQILFYKMMFLTLFFYCWFKIVVLFLFAFLKGFLPLYKKLFIYSIWVNILLCKCFTVYSSKRIIIKEIQWIISFHLPLMKLVVHFLLWEIEIRRFIEWSNWHWPKILPFYIFLILAKWFVFSLQELWKRCFLHLWEQYFLVCTLFSYWSFLKWMKVPFLTPFESLFHIKFLI